MISERKSVFWIFVPPALILMPNVIWLFVAPDPVDALVLGVAPSLMFIVGMFAWVGRRPGVVILVLLPFAPLVPLETYYIWNFQSPSSVHVLGIVADTTPREAREYIGEQGLLMIAVAILAIMAVFLLAVRSLGLSAAFPRHRIWLWLGIAATLPVLSLVAAEHMLMLPSDSMSAMVKVSDSEERKLVANLQLNVDDVLSPGFPLGVPIRMRSFWLEWQRLAVARQEVDKLTVAAANAGSAPSQSVVVLVIGESATSTHWGANGYSRNTTPRLDVLKDAVSMRRAVTPWAGTRMSVPIILTGQQDPKSGLSPLSAPSLVKVFRAAGWKVIWLSNQSPMGMHDSAIALHAGQADMARFFNGADYSKTASTDDVLLEPFKQALFADSAARKLLVVHLLGSHFKYKLRYPEAFDRFQPSSPDGAGDSNQALLNAYDNSILFTDHVLGEMIGSLQELPESVSASLLYISDHGQALPTASCRQWGHSQFAASSFRVPALVWMSAESQRRHAGAMDRLKVLRDAPLHTSEVFDTMIDLAQIEFAGAKQSKSWLSSGWQPQKRLIGGGADFDSTPVGGACQLLNSAG